MAEAKSAALEANFCNVAGAANPSTPVVANIHYWDVKWSISLRANMGIRVGMKRWINGPVGTTKRLGAMMAR